MIWFDMIWYDLIWFDSIWYDMIWFDMICFDLIWYDLIWFGMISYNMIWYDMIWYDIWFYLMWIDMISYDLVWYDLIRCDMIWYAMIWFDMTWYDSVWLCQVWFSLVWFWFAMLNSLLLFFLMSFFLYSWIQFLRFINIKYFCPLFLLFFSIWLMFYDVNLLKSFYIRLQFHHLPSQDMYIDQCEYVPPTQQILQATNCKLQNPKQNNSSTYCSKSSIISCNCWFWTGLSKLTLLHKYHNIFQKQPVNKIKNVRSHLRARNHRRGYRLRPCW